MDDEVGDTVLSRISAGSQWLRDVRIRLGLCGAPLRFGFELVSCVALGFSPAFRQLSFFAPPRTFRVLGDAGVVFALEASNNSPSFPSCLKYSFSPDLPVFPRFPLFFPRFRVVCAARVVEASATQVVFQRLATRVQRPQHSVHAALP